MFPLQIWASTSLPAWRTRPEVSAVISFCLRPSPFPSSCHLRSTLHALRPPLTPPSPTHWVGSHRRVKSFALEELTITQLQELMAGGRATAVALVIRYRARVE